MAEVKIGLFLTLVIKIEQSGNCEAGNLRASADFTCKGGPVLNSLEERIPPFVFVADREREIADALAATLNENGYDAVAFSSGEQLVQAASVMKPHVVISAAWMDGLTGAEAAIRICENIPECRVVLCVDQESADESLRQIAEQNRFFLIPRPVDPRALLHCLDGITSRVA